MEECMLSELQKEEILELISLKQEGAYWDFKKEWYEEGVVRRGKTAGFAT